MSLPATAMLVSTFFTKAKRITSIRELSMNIQTETFSDTDIEKTAIRKDNKVFNLTAKFDWIDTDEHFPMVIDASNCFTAVEILRGIGTSDAQAEATALETKAENLIKEINGNSPLLVKPETLTTDGIGGNDQGTFN